MNAGQRSEADSSVAFQLPEEMEITRNSKRKTPRGAIHKRVQFRSIDFHFCFSNLQMETTFSCFSRENKREPDFPVPVVLLPV